MAYISKENLSDITESVCIITDKVYASCQLRECFPKVEVDLGTSEFNTIKFRPGFILDGSLFVSDVPNRNNFKRVRFTLRIPFIITRKDGSRFESFLPDIFKDIILFIPEHRDEFDFRIVIETASEMIGEIICKNESTVIEFPIGVFMIVKVVGKVQLSVPTFGICKEPPESENYQPAQDIKKRFQDRPFPQFFPPQFEDLYPKD